RRQDAHRARGIVGARSYVWGRLDLDGSVYVRLDEDVAGVEAHGYEICAEDGTRWGAHFRVLLDAGWRHRRTTGEGRPRAGARSLQPAAAGGAWRRGG